MRPWVRVALGCLVLAACAKKERGDSGAAPAPSAAPAATGKASADALKDVAVPVLAAPWRADRVPDGPLVVASAKSIVLEGEAVAVVENGAVDASVLQGARDEGIIAPLANRAESYAKLPEAPSWEAVLVAIDPKLPSELALQVARSFRPSKQHRFAFVVEAPDGTGAVPVTVPAAAPPVVRPSPGQDPGEVPLGIVVALIPDRVLVVSLSRLEGTLAEPRLDLRPASDPTWLTRLRDDLTEIAKRRWEGRTRPDHQKTIYVIADGTVASGDLVAAIAAVRHDAKGQALFPDVQLLTGLELDLDGEAAAAKAPEPAKTDDAAKAAEEARRLAMSMALEEEASRYAAMLTAEPGSYGESDLDSKRRPGAELSDQIRDVREGGNQVAIGGGARVGLGRGPDITGPAGAGSATGASDVLKTPAGRISVAAKDALDDTSLTADVVLQKIQTAYMAGLKRCYKNELKKDPSMRGAVELRLTVNEAGRVIGPRASGFGADLDRCLEALMTSWRFPAPKDGDGEATEASFRIKLVLAPE